MSQNVQTSQLQQRVQLLEAENRQLRQFISWEDRLFSNPHLSASQKLAFRQTELEMEKGTPDDAGYIHVNVTYVSKKIGMSAKITGKNLQAIAEANGLERRVETCVLEDGTQQTKLFFAPTDQTTKPHLIQPPQPRNHGGARKLCNHCGSENLLEQVTITCMDCGAEQHRTHRVINMQPSSSVTATATSSVTAPLPALLTPTPSLQEQAELAQPIDNLTIVLEPEKPLDNLSIGTQKPASPPVVEETEESEQETIPAPECELVNLFLDIAGDNQEHIVMNRGAKKYITVHTPLTEHNIQQHLAGTKTVGSTLSHTDQTTRAVCFDTDTQEGLTTLHTAMCKLHSAGVKPLLEISPAGRGGHLWIIFSSRVRTTAAYQHICTIAPMLKDIKEYWPRANNQKVRLLAGKYVSQTIIKWCQIVDAENREVVKNDLLQYLTLAELIPTTSSLEEKKESTSQEAQAKNFRQQAQAEGVDQYHRRKYTNNHFLVEWTPQQLAALYNERNNVYDLLPPEKNGYGLAEWRGERTASVAYRSTDAWVDFGAEAQEPNGKRDGGDCFELFARRNGDTKNNKSQSMTQFSRDLQQEARRAIEQSAENQESPPPWVQQFMTEIGWSYYEQLRKKQNTHGGIVGFLTVEVGNEPEIQAICIECSQKAEHHGYCLAHWKQTE
ncbi:MAG: TOTE conflict system archaeo-eukaryotic primase domain-containing protein [Flavisolibacter sp.]